MRKSILDQEKESPPHVMGSDNPNFERYLKFINHEHNYNIKVE